MLNRADTLALDSVKKKKMTECPTRLSLPSRSVRQEVVRLQSRRGKIIGFQVPDLIC